MIHLLALLFACATSTNTPAPATAPPAPAAPPAAQPAPAPAAATVATVGKPAPDFSLPAIDGSTVRLADLKGKTVVLEWFNPGCPFVQYAHADGPLKDLAAKTTAQGVVWLAINSSAPGKEGHGLATNQEAAKSWNMSHPVLLDENGEVGKKYGAKTTPHMYVIDAGGTLAYAGALDNAPLGKIEGDAQVSYVTAAIDALMKVESVPTPSTKPYGCSVKYGS